MNQAKLGFTLIEVMVVITIIGILATVVFVNARPAGEQARDTQRQADLRDVQTALEQYKSRYGRYPEGCNGVTTLNTFGNPVAGVWSGQPGSSYACSDPADPYILGDTTRPFAEFMVNLPTDPKLNGSNSGYVYTTNEEGSVYKFLAKNTVESEVVDYDHPFKSCDVSYNFAVEAGSPSVADHVRSCDPPNPNTDFRRIGCDIAMCDRLYDGTRYNAFPGAPPPFCREGSALFESSYAVWGGISHVTNDFFLQPGEEERLRVHIERQTENIICRLLP